jgi:hypothetical protein
VVENRRHECGTSLLDGQPVSTAFLIGEIATEKINEVYR